MLTTKKKVYYIILGKSFPRPSENSGKGTEFTKKVTDGVKVQTIRTDYGKWIKIAEAINKDEAILSIRAWGGRPYNSNQVEVCYCDRIEVLHFRAGVYQNQNNKVVFVEGKPITGTELDQFARDEGFADSYEMFDYLFPPNSKITPTTFEGALVKFKSIKQ